MDKKNTLLGILCILAGLGFMFKQNADLREQQLEEERIAEQQQQAWKVCQNSFRKELKGLKNSQSTRV